MRVTSLASKGEGTLRAALEAEGPRVVVFEVGGVIDLEGDSLRLLNPFITIAGQTAPPPGITIIRGDIGIGTHDILIQHIRVRPGDLGQPKESGWEPDGITTSSFIRNAEHGPHRVVIDHCSLTWAVDENLSASGSRHKGRSKTSHDITFSNCLIAEGLDDSTHPKGPHSKGTLIHDHVRNVAILRNLYACNADRNPMLKPDSSAAVVNNLIYNPLWSAIRTTWPEQEYEGRSHEMLPCDLVAVGNVMWPGPDTPGDLPMFRIADGRAHVHVRDNHIQVNGSLREHTVSSPEPIYRDEPMCWPEPLTLLPAQDTVEHVFRCAGAWPADRDAIDARILDGVRQRTGRVIDGQDEVEGYPTVEPTRHDLVVPADPHAVADDGGYTNLDLWLHELATRVEGSVVA